METLFYFKSEVGEFFCNNASTTLPKSKLCAVIFLFLYAFQVLRCKDNLRLQNWEGKPETFTRNSTLYWGILFSLIVQRLLPDRCELLGLSSGTVNRENAPIKNTSTSDDSSWFEHSNKYVKRRKWMCILQLRLKKVGCEL